MAYGITDKSQLIDIDTIQSGCERLKDAANDFDRCGADIVSAGIICDKKALSVDEASLEITINDLGEEVKDIKTAIIRNADQLLSDATTIYNMQVAELNEYNRKLEQEYNSKQ